MRAVADEHLGAAGLDRVAARVVDVEEREAVFGGFDLRLVSQAQEFGARVPNERDRASRLLEFAHEQVAHERFGRGIRRLEHHEAVTAEQLVQPAGKRGGHSGAGPVVPPQLGDDLRRELGRRELPLQLGNGVLDAAVEHERRDHLRPRAGDIRQRYPMKGKIRIEDVGGTDFVPVVIFLVHPEQRHRGHAVLLADPGGQLDRGDGFQDGVEGAAEETCLLAGDHRHGPRVLQLGGGASRLCRRVSPLELRGRGPRRPRRDPGRHVARARWCGASRPAPPDCPRTSTRPTRSCTHTRRPADESTAGGERRWRHGRRRTA